MAEKKPRRRRKDDIELGPLGKEKGKISGSLDAGNMVAVVSGMEVMYVFLHQKQYFCFIHPFDSEEGRKKAWAVNERNTAMLDNLYSAADHLFEIRFQQGMDYLGIMVAAEKGIIAYLDMTGQLPAEDMDFMDWQDKSDSSEKEMKK